MLDIKFVRENKEVVKENIKKKFQDEKLPLVDEVIELDKRIRELKVEGDAKMQIDPDTMPSMEVQRLPDGRLRVYSRDEEEGEGVKKE